MRDYFMWKQNANSKSSCAHWLHRLVAVFLSVSDAFAIFLIFHVMTYHDSIKCCKNHKRLFYDYYFVIVDQDKNWGILNKEFPFD